MDLAWQELMAITELQEFEVPGEGPYETTPYHTMDPMVAMGGYGASQSHHEPLPAACDLNPAAAYEASYSDMAPACHRLSSTTDDLESDSGLSLGSSPPLASPDNAATSAPGYHNTDVGMTYSDGETDSITGQARGAHIQYSMDYQCQPLSYLYSGAHSSYYSSHPTSSHTQPNALTSASMKQQPGQVSALNDLHINDSVVSSRGSSQQTMYVKPQGNSSAPAPLSRDERRAMALKIPFPMDKIINLPVDDFNELLTQYTLTDTQLALVRDIRRRGKNKVAAQNCRKRKLENIVHLEGELRQLQAQREHLAQERLEFQRSLSFIKCHLTDLYTEVFSHLRDEDGQPYSIDEYSLQQTPDGKIYLVPRTAMQGRE
uniref:Nuclear factor, erythroid 2 n=1 Tax=Myripristis murdjan TaxID=586833 RepID=A0A667YSZ1_9TELE